MPIKKSPNSIHVVSWWSFTSIKITAYLSDKDPRVISTAIEALEGIGNTKTLGYIAQLVSHNHNRVKATAMKVLYNLGDQSALKLLQKWRILRTLLTETQQLML